MSVPGAITWHSELPAARAQAEAAGTLVLAYLWAPG